MQTLMQSADMGSLLQIASGGRILLGSRLVMNGKQKTFAVALSRQMAPTAHIVAYCIEEGEVVTDALSFYVRDTRLLMVRPWCFVIYLFISIS